MNHTQTLIPSVNFHLWEPCNFSCKFCFATFQDVRKTILPKGHLPEIEALKIIDVLAEAGFSKITFAGGEPTLCPWLDKLITKAKNRGLTTMVVTNGSNLNQKFLANVKDHLDWIALSIDSAIPETNTIIGRKQGVNVLPDAEWYLEKGRFIKSFGIRLKINTVINKYNCQEQELRPLVEKLSPERWKIFQVLPVEGQNDKFFEQFKISSQQFEEFKQANSIKESGFPIVFENNNEMQGSYAMINPAGRFYDNTKGFHTYSEPILKVGVMKSLSQVTSDYERFILRGGLYSWK